MPIRSRRRQWSARGRRRSRTRTGAAGRCPAARPAPCGWCCQSPKCGPHRTRGAGPRCRRGSRPRSPAPRNETAPQDGEPEHVQARDNPVHRDHPAPLLTGHGGERPAKRRADARRPRQGQTGHAGFLARRRPDPPVERDRGCPSVRSGLIVVSSELGPWPRKADRGAHRRPRCWYQRSGMSDLGGSRNRLLAQRPETRAYLIAQQLRLFPGREVPTRLERVVVDQVPVSPLCPSPRRLVALAGEDTDGNRYGNVLGAEERELVLPVETSRRHGRVRQPVEGYVVNDVLPRDGPKSMPFDDRARNCSSLMASWSSIQVARPTGESANPDSVCGRVPISVA